MQCLHTAYYTEEFSFSPRSYAYVENDVARNCITWQNHENKR